MHGESGATRRTLPDEERRKVLEALEPYTDEDAPIAIEWARQARIGAIMLDLVLSGEMTIGVDHDGELAFRRTER